MTAQPQPTNQIKMVENIHTIAAVPDSNGNGEEQRSKEQCYEQMSKNINDDIVNAFIESVQQEYSHRTMAMGPAHSNYGGGRPQKATYSNCRQKKGTQGRHQLI